MLISESGALMEALLSLPLFSLLIAGVTVGLVAVVRRPKLRRVPARYVGEARALGTVAVGVIAIFGVENIVRGYLLRLVDIVDWWRYPTPLLAAAVGLAVFLVILARRGSLPPEEPGIPITRRSWTSFTPKGYLAAVFGTLVILILISVGAGLESSADADGRFIYLEINAPNADIEPLRPWFYGWWYGVPVIVSALLLGAIAGAVLQRNAARPFLRPETVADEREARSRIGTSVARIAFGAGLLSLAGALRFIDNNGTLSSVTLGDTGASYELVWRYAPFAAVGGWIAPILEIIAFAALLIAAVGGIRTRAAMVIPAEKEVAR